MEQRSLLPRRKALGDALEGVPHHGVGIRHLIDREVALKHASVHPELLNAPVKVGCHGPSQLG